MKASYFLLFLIFIGQQTSALSQNIEGAVICQNKPAACNAVLLSVKDSSLLTGGFFIDGRFKLINPSEKEVFLKLSGLQLRDTLIHVSYRDSINLGEINVQIRMLDGVTVIAPRESYETKSNGFKLKVSTSYLKDLGMAVDILKMAPMVIVNSDEAIRIVGREASPLILLNGREIHNIEEIKSLSSSSIRNINIITEPSAKYDASVTSVIEIETKKQNRKGISARLDTKAGSGKEFRHKESVSISLNTGKLQLFGNYKYSYTNKSPFIEDITKIFLPSDTLLLFSKNQQNQKWNNKSYIVGINYILSKKHEVGVQLNGFKYGVKSINSLNSIYSSKSKYITLKTSDFDKNRIGLNVSHRMQIHPNISQLNSYFDYVLHKQDSEEMINEDYNNIFSLKRNFSKNKYRIWSIKSEYSHNIKESDFGLVFGMKMSKVKGDGNLLFKKKENGNWEEDKNLSNRFNNEENLLAGYLELKKTIRDFDFKFGGRLEYIERYGSDTYQNTPIIDTSYVRFFPSFSVLYKLADDGQLGFNYTNKTQRPSYRLLTQTISYQDSKRYFQGNPYLTPTYSNEFVLKYVFKKDFGIIGKYQNINDFIDVFVDFDGEYLKTTFSNYKKFDKWSLTIFGGYSNNWMTLRSTAKISKPKMEVLQLGELVLLDKTGFYFDLSANFNLWKKAMLNCKYFNNMNDQYGATLRVNASNLSLGITQKFFKDKMIARFTANDVFDKVRYGGERFVGSIYEDRIEFQDSKTFMFSLSYFFNNYKSYKKKSGLDDESRRL